MQLCLWSVHIKVKFCFDCEPHTHTTSNKSFFVKSPKIFSCIQTLNFKTLLPSWLGIWSPQINDSVHRLYQVTQRYCSELIHRKRCNSIRVHISGVTKCVTKFLTHSKTPHRDSVQKLLWHQKYRPLITENGKILLWPVHVPRLKQRHKPML